MDIHTDYCDICRRGWHEDHNILKTCKLCRKDICSHCSGNIKGKVYCDSSYPQADCYDKVKKNIELKDKFSQLETLIDKNHSDKNDMLNLVEEIKEISLMNYRARRISDEYDCGEFYNENYDENGNCKFQ